MNASNRFNPRLPDRNKMVSVGSNVQATLADATRCRDRGDFSGAVNICRDFLADCPDTAPILAFWGGIAYRKGDFARALNCVARAIALAPEVASHHQLLGNIYKRMGDLQAAKRSLERAVALQPSAAAAHYDLGIVYQIMGQTEAALSRYQFCVAAMPGYAPAWNNMGLILLSMADVAGAVICFERAIIADPKFVGAYNNLAATKLDSGQFGEAVRLSRKALAIANDDYRAYLNMGNALLKQDLYQQAITCYRQGLRCSPDHPELLNSLGVAHQKNGNPEAAIACFQKTIRFNPNAHKSVVHLYNQLRHICDWQRAESISRTLDDLTQFSLKKDDVPVEPPFMSICRDMDEKRHFQIARRWSHGIEKKVAVYRRQHDFGVCRRDGKRLRIGYLTNNFRNHPTTQLLCRIFELHDRQRFRVSAYSCSARSQYKYARIVQETSDAFTELYQMDAPDAARTITSDGIDILVDLNGYTDGHRMEISALRPAPIQVRYLGMAGTTGATFFDYLIGDGVVTPESAAPYYSEQLVRMPYTYQANSYRFDAETIGLGINHKDGERDTPFTFCCFCANYKIEKPVFDAWMNILDQVSGSMLWLLGESQSIKRRLRREAAARGISPERLHFAEKLDKTEHLIRLQKADLALDTEIVTGAATTSDALWAGVPVITVNGDHFASRMSASILTALSLPELIAENLQEYESVAIELATCPQKIKAVREKLLRRRETAALFDTPLFVRHMEYAYRKMWEIHRSGLPPRPINLTADSV